MSLQNDLSSIATMRAFPRAETKTGTYFGSQDAQSGVISFKGIPFAKAPVGELRWLPPQELEESSAGHAALKFGDVPLQNLTNADKAAGYNASEDILKLNIWTSDTKLDNKPVMVYIHGGSFIAEAAARPEYSGQYIVEQNPDIIVVTIDYRVNTMGFANLKDVPGYSDKYAAAGYLGILDDIAALKWIKENIASFGGDPNNVTIFGESAGGGSVADLLASTAASGLFAKAIVQSGGLNLTYTQEQYEALDQVGEIMKATGAQNMNDLLALNKEQILKVWDIQTQKVGPEGGSAIGNIQGMPLRGEGSILPEDPYAALEAGVNSNIPLLIGTTGDEWRYWNYALNGWIENQDITFGVYADITANKRTNYESQVSPENKQYLDAYFASLNIPQDAYSLKYPGIWENTEIANDVLFRMPAVEMANAHANAGGDTYMYYFDKKSDANDWIGSAHGSELSYVFYNLDHVAVETGTIDPVLAKQMVTMWTNFARSGNPSTQELAWTPYTEQNGATMVVGANGELSMQNNFKATQNELLEKSGINLKYFSLESNAMDNSYNVDLMGFESPLMF